MLLKSLKGLLLLAALALQVAYATATPVLSPTAEERTALKKWLDSLPPGGRAVPCDARYIDAYRAMLRIGGRTPENSPEDYKLLDAIKTPGWRPSIPPTRYGVEHPADDFEIVGVTDTSKGRDFTNVVGRIFSTIFTSATDATANETQIGMIFKAGDESNPIGYLMDSSENAVAMRSMWGDIPPTSEPNNADGGAVIVTGTFRGTVDSRVFCYDSKQTTMASPDSHNISAPDYGSNNTNKKGPVVVCLNRANPSDGGYCDYGPTQPGAENGQVHMLLPSRGSFILRPKVHFHSMQTADGRKIPADPTGKPAPLTLKLVAVEGGACDAVYKGDEVWPTFEITKNTNGQDVLSWDFLGDPPDPKKFLDFGTKCYDATNNAPQDYLFLMTAIFLDNDDGKIINLPDPMMLSVQSSGVTSTGVPETNMADSLTVAFQWGCLIKGTLVTMADGTTKLIEDLKKGDLVMAAGHAALRVEGVGKGWDTKFIKLTDDKGEMVEVTETHPVLTVDGMKEAQELERGDRVIGRDGEPSRLTSVERVSTPKSVPVYSVALEQPDGARLSKPYDGLMFAGSILVGDFYAQGEVMKQASSAIRVRNEKVSAHQ